MKKVVILSSIQWDFTWQRHQILASFFLKRGYRTAFVDSTGIANPSLSDIGRIIFKRYLGVGVEGNPVPEGLVRIKPLILPPTYRIFRALNRLFFIPPVARGLLKEGFEGAIVIAYPPTHTTLSLIDRIKPSLLIYDCVSYFKEYPGAPADIEDTEQQLIEKSDLVLADSDFLYERLKGRAKRLVQLPPGVDFQHFQKADKGPLRELKKLCYFGTLDFRIDLELIKEVARIFPDKEIVFVGRVKEDPGALPANVILTGYVSPERLPEKIRDCDCIIWPYRALEFCKGIIPAKFFEALATGKPVVAIGLPVFEKYRDYLYVAKDRKEFIEILKRLPELEDENRRRKRLELAKQNSWEARFSLLEGWIERLLSETGKN